MKLKMMRLFLFGVLVLALLIPVVGRAQSEPEANTKNTYSEEELAQMLAPVALYPDALLTQILMAAAYPFEVVEAERWVTKNPYVTGEALNEALQAKDWDVSVLALCHYPKILTMMSDNLDWTASLGDAFADQEEAVMETIQELRRRASEAGHLKTSPEQRVIIEERYISIVSPATDYFYVPAYDPLVVYGAWWLPLYPPISIFLPGLVLSGPGIVFSPRISIGFSEFGWSYFNWPQRHIVIADIDRTRRYNRHAPANPHPERHRWRPDNHRRYPVNRSDRNALRYRPPASPGPYPRRDGSERIPGVISPGVTRPPHDPDRRTEPGPDRRRMAPPGPQPIGPAPPQMNDRPPRIRDTQEPRRGGNERVSPPPPVLRDRGVLPDTRPRMRDDGVRRERPGDFGQDRPVRENRPGGGMPRDRGQR